MRQVGEERRGRLGVKGESVNGEGGRVNGEKEK